MVWVVCDQQLLVKLNKILECIGSLSLSLSLIFNFSLFVSTMNWKVSGPFLVIFLSIYLIVLTRFKFYCLSDQESMSVALLGTTFLKPKISPNKSIDLQPTKLWKRNSYVVYHLR